MQHAPLILLHPVGTCRRHGHHPARAAAASGVGVRRQKHGWCLTEVERVRLGAQQGGCNACAGKRRISSTSGRQLLPPPPPPPPPAVPGLLARIAAARPPACRPGSAGRCSEGLEPAGELGERLHALAAGRSAERVAVKLTTHDRSLRGGGGQACLTASCWGCCASRVQLRAVEPDNRRCKQPATARRSHRYGTHPRGGAIGAFSVAFSPGADLQWLGIACYTAQWLQHALCSSS